MDKYEKAETVRNLVTTIMEKLAMKGSIEHLVEQYNNTSVQLSVSSTMKIKDRQSSIRNEEEPEDSDTIIPECAKMCFYPWPDVLASMYTMPENVKITETVCPNCGEKLIELYFSSPSWTWRALCGRGGQMTICPNCPKQVDFVLTRMN